MEFNFIKNKKMENKYENLYDYMFHYNIYTNEWNAFLREDSNKYMAGTNNDVVIFKDSDINKLIEKIASLQTHESL